MSPSQLLHRWWSREVVGAIDHDDVVGHVRADAGWSAHFAFMTILSAGIAILGLLLSSPAVVIGAMLISPLMGPIVGAGFALATFDTAELRRAVFALVLGTVIATAFCAILVLLSPLQSVTSEIAARTRPNLFDLVVALLSGFAGTYAVIRGRHGAIVGVAIATALMPPIAVMGFGIATGDKQVLEGSALLFFTNLMTIAAAAAALARFYGFAGDLSPQQTRLQLLLFFGSLALLAVPLGISLNRIAWEAVTTRQVTDEITETFGPNARVDNVAVGYHSDPLQVSATVLTPKYQRNVEEILGKKLNSAIGRKVEVTINQVRTSDGTSTVGDLAVSAADQQAKEIAANLAAAAGISEDAVIVDSHRHKGLAVAAPLPGATLATYRAIEERLSAAYDGWDLEIVPPVLPLGELESADPAALEQALATAAWAAERLHLTIKVDGRPKEANAIADRLSALRAPVQRGVSTGTPSISWILPDRAGTGARPASSDARPAD